MALSPGQVKGRINNLAKANNANPSVLMRLYMMERFLERVANSPYSKSFIIKGGVLVTSLLGVSLRSTMDIDATVLNLDLSEEMMYNVISEIGEIDIHDGVSFTINSVSHIMDEMEYPGFRFAVEAKMGKMVTPIKIDISTGDALTPGAIKYDYNLMLENRSIILASYNLETLLSEKLQTILSRGVLNTRMRDYYDIYSLHLRFSNQINKTILRKAFESTCQRRGTLELYVRGEDILKLISKSTDLPNLWEVYKKKYEYASGIPFANVIEALKSFLKMMHE